jgi:hypothetical protein
MILPMPLRSAVSPLLTAALAVSLAACTGDRASGPLPQEAYVWQRSWGPELRAAISQADGIAGLTLLAAEIDPAQRPPQVVRIGIPGSAGVSPASNSELALRIGAFPGRFVDDPALVSLIVETAREVLQDARARGLSPSEIQIDYDCPESKLDDYLLLVRRLKEEIAPVPVTITALPSWLRHHRALGRLVDEADGWVLQVHSVAPPGPSGELVLCDPAEAREAVERAARFERPFRVALPTYGYAAAFDSSGKLLGLSAEGWPRRWPAGVTVREIRSDPEALAGLVRDWTADRPREMAGVVWYRLPVKGDLRNWSWPTLAAVMAGRVPRPKPRLALRAPAPGLVEIDLINEGDGDAPWPAAVRVLWEGDRLLAADALAGYRARFAGPDELRIERSGHPRLRPGERRVIAWLRFSSPTEIRVAIPTPPAG